MSKVHQTKAGSTVSNVQMDRHKSSPSPSDSLPDLKAASSTVLTKGDALIVVAGFEHRATAFGDVFLSDGRADAIFMSYEPNDPRNRPDDVKNELVKIGFGESQISPLVYHQLEPSGFAVDLRNLLSSLNVHRVFIDVSGMSRLAILLSLDACREISINAVVYYAEAGSYGPKKMRFDAAKASNDLWRPSINVYTGVEDVYRVRRFSSVAMQGYPSAVIAFMSFNEKFIQALLNRFNPSCLYLINGRPPKHSWREKATAWIHETLCEEWARFNPVDPETGLPARSASTLYYGDTYQVLYDLYWELCSRFRLVLAPTGSKMQAVGCYLFRAVHNDVHIEYPTPSGFLDEYSEGIGNQWMLDFGNLAGLVNELVAKEREIHMLIKAPTGA